MAVVVVSFNGARWLPGLLESLAVQTRLADHLVLVDNGSADDSVAIARELGTAAARELTVVEAGRNTGFAAGVNRGVAEVAGHEVLATVNTDVVLDPDWVARMSDALLADPRHAMVACKMVDLADRGRLYAAGDRLRRDGVCEQRGRFRRDDGRYDAPGQVWGACAGAAVYRGAALASVGGFDERLFLYLEDVDLALRLRMAGWTCGWEPVVAAHAGESSSSSVPARPPGWWVQRNTLLLATKAFPARWLPLLLYRQAAWLAAALRADARGTTRPGARWRATGTHLRATAAALPLLPAMVAERRRLRQSAVVDVATAVPPAPIRRRAGADAPPRRTRPATRGETAGRR